MKSELETVCTKCGSTRPHLGAEYEVREAADSLSGHCEHGYALSVEGPTSEPPCGCRPVACLVCVSQMYYAEDSRFEPEFKITRTESGHATEHYGYVHQRCWNTRADSALVTAEILRLKTERNQLAVVGADLTAERDKLRAALLDCVKRMEMLRELLKVSGAPNSHWNILDTKDARAVLASTQSTSDTGDNNSTKNSQASEADLKLLREIYEHFDGIQDGAEDASYSDRMANKFVEPLGRLIARKEGK